MFNAFSSAGLKMLKSPEPGRAKLVFRADLLALLYYESPSPSIVGGPELYRLPGRIVQVQSQKKVQYLPEMDESVHHGGGYL